MASGGRIRRCAVWRRPTAAATAAAALLAAAVLVLTPWRAQAFLAVPAPSSIVSSGLPTAAAAAAGAAATASSRRRWARRPTTTTTMLLQQQQQQQRQRFSASSKPSPTALAAQPRPKEKEIKGIPVSVWHPDHPYRDAFVKTAISVGAALLFGLGVWHFKGADSGLEYYSGYLVEQSLSVDNLFVFVVLFEYFKVPPDYQGRVLSWGIFGAMAMRAVMVLAGVEAIENFRAVLLVFAGILVFTSVKLLAEDGGEDGEEDLADNTIVQFARNMITTVDYYDGSRFFTYVDGARVATPLLLCLICVELSDVVFAVDSVPAVFGVTKDPFIVYTSNIFAILGLRSLYTVLANAMVDLPYLKPAVAVILGLVGGKLGLEYFGYDIPNLVSLAVIASLLGVGVGASVYYRPNPDQ